MTVLVPRIGLAVIARPQFDTAYADEILQRVWPRLDGLDAELVGSRDPLFDAAAVDAAIPSLREGPLDLLLILQATFADSSMAVKLAEGLQVPIVLWSFPEPRTGGRLRLNTICGTNLAAHALGRLDAPFTFLHREPDDPEVPARITALARAAGIKRRLAESRIGVVGDFPDGFDSCRYDPDALKALCGIETEKITMGEFLDKVRQVPDEAIGPVRTRVEAELGDLSHLDQESLGKSFKVYKALRGLADDSGFSGVAVRCWPEFFTELGGAACGPMGMLGEDGTPCGCEADVYGTLTTLILRWLSNQPAFNSDLVDVDVTDDTAVFWHCGQAPISMADSEGPRRPTVHSNRKMPLLYEFSFKPGRVTLARLSQSRNQTRMVIGGGEVLRRPTSYSGTSGVVRFDRPASDVLDAIMREGLEHHISLAYGDHRPALRHLAAMLDIPVLELT